MTKELNLQISDSLHQTLVSKANMQGVSLEALCLSLLNEGDSELRAEPLKIGSKFLLDPALYRSMSNGRLREEIERVANSELSPEDIKKRVNLIQQQVLRFMRR